MYVCIYIYIYVKIKTTFSNLQSAINLLFLNKWSLGQIFWPK